MDFNGLGGAAISGATHLNAVAMEHHFEAKRQSIWEHCQVIDPMRDAGWINRFTYYSANLRHFLPALPEEDHLGLFRATAAHERYAALDIERFVHGVGYPVSEHGGDLVSALTNLAGVVCSFHTGAHLSIALKLIEADVPFAALVSAAAKQRLLEKSAQTLGRRCPKVVWIAAEAPGALSQLIHHLKKGISVLAFIDGGGGSHALRLQGLPRIPFLGQHLYIRLGIPFAAWLAGVPIYPVFPFRRANNVIDLYHTPPIHGVGAPKALFINHAATAIFTGYGAYLQHHPAQWLNWWELHRLVDAVSYIRSPERISKQSFGLLVDRGSYFAFDRDKYLVKPLKTAR